MNVPSRGSRAHGFTLIELLVTIAIIAVLAAIAIPQFAEYRQNGFDARSKSDLRAAAMGEEAYFVDNDQYIDCIGSSSCQSTLPAFTTSSGVNISMFEVPAAGGVPTHFTGTAFHTAGKRNSLGSSYVWNSLSGGLQ